MNTPYVRQYENGELVNGFEKTYISTFPNRAARRARPKRFRGNHSGISLTVMKTGRYKRVIQTIKMIIKDRKGKALGQTVENNHVKYKRLQHYILK